MKVLFVCSQGLMRSPTAAELYAKWHETRFIGIYNHYLYNKDENVAWADIIVCMEDKHAEPIKKRTDKQVIVLGTTGLYPFFCYF